MRFIRCLCRRIAIAIIIDEESHVLNFVLLLLLLVDLCVFREFHLFLSAAEKQKSTKAKNITLGQAKTTKQNEKKIESNCHLPLLWWAAALLWLYLSAQTVSMPKHSWFWRNWAETCKKKTFLKIKKFLNIFKNI